MEKKERSFPFSAKRHIFRVNKIVSGRARPCPRFFLGIIFHTISLGRLPWESGLTNKTSWKNDNLFKPAEVEIIGSFKSEALQKCCRHVEYSELTSIFCRDIPWVYPPFWVGDPWVYPPLGVSPLQHWPPGFLQIPNPKPSFDTQITPWKIHMKTSPLWKGKHHLNQTEPFFGGLQNVKLVGGFNPF